MLSSRLLFYWLYLVPILLFSGCASPRAPTGGEKDELPPVLIEEASTPNLQTNFHEKEIILTFDEWFTLKNVLSQLVISPLMPAQPDVKQKGKSIFITLPDSLKEETTYTINFGSAIADLNEGNVLENFAFVFSTGSVLDSVFITGHVVNAVTLQAAADVLVMLHPINEDSAVYKSKPEYVCRTDKEGRWKLENVRLDSFRVVALIDDNLNFLYDLETEYFGWYDDTLYTIEPKILLPDIVLFPKERRTSIRDVIHEAPGWLKVIVDGPQPYTIPTMVPPIEEVITAWDLDTIHFWYPPELNFGGNVILANDTSKVQPARESKTTKRDFLVSNRSGKLMPNGTAQLYAPIPFSSIDTSRIRLIVDSMVQVAYTIEADSLDARILWLKGKWKSNAIHQLTILPGGFENVLGNQNDTISISIQVADPNDFGDLVIEVNGLDSTQFYIVKLMSGSQLVATSMIAQLSHTSFVHKGLVPGKYQVEMVEDSNRNGFWDTGDFQLKRQAERKMIFTLESLRAAWEVESTITWLR